MRLNHSSDFSRFAPTPTLQTPVPPVPLRPADTIAALASDMQIETAAGWRAAADLGVGDLVHTLDGGLVPVATTQRHILPRYASDLWFVPQGVLNNCDALRLTGGQCLLISDPACDRLFGRSEVLLPVRALAGFRGIAKYRALAPTETIALTFDQEEVIFAQSGTLVHCAATLPEQDGFFHRIGYGDARALLALMDQGHCAPDVTSAALSLAA